MKGILIDVVFTGAEVFGLLTADRDKLTCQHTDCVRGDGMGKAVTQAFPTVGLNMWNTIFGPAQLDFIGRSRLDDSFRHSSFC